MSEVLYPLVEVQPLTGHTVENADPREVCPRFRQPLFLKLGRGWIQILHGEVQSGEDFFCFAPRVAVKKNFSVPLLGDRKAVFSVIVCRAPGTTCWNMPPLTSGVR